MRKKEFVATVLDLEYETVVVYIISLSFTFLTNSNVYLSHKSQITSLIIKKALIKVLAKYINFTNMFSLDLFFKLLEHSRINNNIIKLVDSQQPLYGPIYNLKSVDLEILKVYIETNLAKKFIKLSKSPVNALIFFNRKLDKFY